MFVVYDKDGMIDQTVIGPDESYGEILDKAGHTWLFLEGVSSVDITRFHVDTVEKTVKPNLTMPVLASKTQIAADGVEISMITDIPPNTVVQVFCDDQLHAVETVSDFEISFSTVTPGTYKFGLSSKRYMPCELKVTAQ